MFSCESKIIKYADNENSYCYNTEVNHKMTSLTEYVGCECVCVRGILLLIARDDVLLRTLKFPRWNCPLFMTRTKFYVCYICQKLKEKFVSYLPVIDVADIIVEGYNSKSRSCQSSVEPSSQNSFFGFSWQPMRPQSCCQFI